MDFLENIIRFIKALVNNPKKIIVMLICVLVLQTIIGLLYIRSLRKNPGFANEFEQYQNDQQKFFNTKFAFTQTEIAFILKGLNIATTELYQYYQPQIDSINGIITKTEKELLGLKNQLRSNTDTARALNLHQQINFTEQQLMFYKVAASFWEDRSKGLKNLIKTLGLDSIMVYLTHQDSINQNLAKLAAPQIITSQRAEKPINPKPERQETEQTAAIHSSSSTPTSFASEEAVINQKKTEPSTTLPVIIQSQPSAVSQKEMIEMLKKHNFFDYYWNHGAKGFSNNFELQILNGDTVVIDSASRLIWQQGGSSKAMSYEDAGKWIEMLNQNQFAGYRNWRLPTLKEALTLVEPDKNDLLYIDSIFSREQKWIWTSDLVAGESCNWIVSFNNGECHSSYNLTISNYYIRAVRSMQVQPE